MSLINPPQSERDVRFCAISTDVLEDLKFPIPLKDAQIYITADRDTILFRQELFKNILDFPETAVLLESVGEKAADLADMTLKNPESASLTNEQLLYSFKELTVFIDLVDYAVEKYDAVKKNVTSTAIKSFFEAIIEIGASEDFEYAKRGVALINENMNSIRSVTVGVNLDAQLSVTEIGLVAINDRPYVSDTKLDKLLRKVNPGEDFHTIAVLGARETGGLTGKTALQFDTVFYHAMNNVVKNLIRNTKKLFTSKIHSDFRTISMNAEDINFITAASKYMLSLKKTGMKLTFPNVAETSNGYATELMTPNLLDKMPRHEIVASDIRFDENGRVFILTGPNSGGKSVFLQAVGIAQIMFQMGLPVAAESAELSICGEVLTHFNKSLSNSIESRLVNETKRLKAILDKTTADSLLLFDETLSSTSAYDAVILADGVLRHIQKTGCKCVYATHLHELAVGYKKLNSDGVKSKVDVLNSSIENGVRSFKIKRAEAGDIQSSYAKDIFVEYGLDFLFE
jgi:Mismatch repair ATPase (MutS family)